MNILIYTAIYPAPDRLDIPSDTKVVHYFAKEWSNCGHHVEVIYLHLRPIKRIIDSMRRKKLIEVSSYEYEKIHVKLIACQLLKPHSRHPSKRQAKKINKIIREMKMNYGRKFDKVFVHFPTAFLGVDELVSDSIPSIATFHNADIITMKNEKEECLKLVNKFCAWGSRSRKIQNYLAELTEKVIVQINSGIDEALLLPVKEVENKANRKNDKMVVVYAGNLIPLKNVDILIKAVKETTFDGIELRIIGDGPEEGRLKELADGDNRIHFLGRLPREQTIEQMRQADVFTMISSPETFGLVYIEAMGQGCLTVGSKGEGIDGVIVDGVNGFLIEPGNKEKLKERLQSLSEMRKEEKQRIILNAYQTASEMTDGKMAEVYLNAI